jgi:hypothetical protein
VFICGKKIQVGLKKKLKLAKMDNRSFFATYGTNVAIYNPFEVDDFFYKNGPHLLDGELFCFSLLIL